jgi:hypothetical protein
MILSQRDGNVTRCINCDRKVTNRNVTERGCENRGTAADRPFLGKSGDVSVVQITAT